MKKLTAVLFTVILFCVPCITAFAEDSGQKGVTVTTTVPADCIITFKTPDGIIEEDGSVVDDTESFDRRLKHTFHIIPDKGKVIDKVFYGGEDVTTQVKDGYFSIPPITRDAVFEFTYADAPVKTDPKPDKTSSPDNTSIVKTGDTMAAIASLITLLTAISSVFIIVLAIADRKRKMRC